MSKKPADKPEPKIVAAAGSTSPLGRGRRGQLIEQAMAGAVREAENEARAIWEKEGMSQEKKSEAIAKIMSPEAILERKVAARARAKEQASAEEAEAAKQ